MNSDHFWEIHHLPDHLRHQDGHGDGLHGHDDHQIQKWSEFNNLGV